MKSAPAPNRRKRSRDRLTRIFRRLTSRHAACLFAATIILVVGVGAALVQSAGVTVESDKISTADLGLASHTFHLQQKHLDRVRTIDDLIRMSTQDLNFDSLVWNDAVARLAEQEQKLNQSLEDASQLVRDYAEGWPDYEQLNDYLGVIRDKSDRLQTESTCLVRLANEGRLDEVRALGPYVQLEGEVLRHQITGFADSVRMAAEHSTRNIQVLGAQQMMAWMVVAGLLLICVGWLIGKEGSAASPNASAAPQPRAPPAREESTRQLHGRHVLVAEDGAANQKMLAAALKSAGARVEVSSDGQEAWDRVVEMQRKGLPFDLVLTDIQMPVMDGLQLTRKLRDHEFLGGIVALTGQAADDLAQRCAEAGCDAYLTKPIDRDQLISVVEQQLDRRAIQRA